MSTSKYSDLGASATKSGLHAALHSAGIACDSAFFAPLNSDLAGNDQFASFLHCDGAGTKSIVAYLLYRETGRVDYFKGLAQDALVMNLDDIFCVGSPSKLLLANTLARNAKLVTDEIVGVIIQGYRELIQTLNSFGIPIELGGGETADCGDVVRTLLVDAVITGRINKKSAINANRIVPGDIIVGLSSTGQAVYEKQPNSGVASNGLTLARHCLLSRYHAERYPEVCAPETDAKFSYAGPFKVTDAEPALPGSVGEALLCPTRTYAPVLNTIYHELWDCIHGVIHLTGGAQTKVLRFGQGNCYRKNNLFPPPPLFALIQKHGGVSDREMYQVFNMGHRIEIYSPPEHAAEICRIADSFGIAAQVVGAVERNPKSAAANRVVVETANGSYEYEL